MKSGSPQRTLSRLDATAASAGGASAPRSPLAGVNDGLALVLQDGLVSLVVPDVAVLFPVEVLVGVGPFARVQLDALARLELERRGELEDVALGVTDGPAGQFFGLLPWFMTTTHSLFRLLLLPVSLPGESYWTFENLTAEAALPSTPARGTAACRPPLREGVHVADCVPMIIQRGHHRERPSSAHSEPRLRTVVPKP